MFSGLEIETLIIVDEVDLILELLVCDAAFVMEELHITQECVGAYVFWGTGISIGLLIYDPMTE